MSWHLTILELTPVPTPSPTPAVGQETLGQAEATWDWKLAIAIYGAITGTIGTLVSWWGRRDVKWRRAAKQVPIVRPAAAALRDAVAEARAGTRTLVSLREVVLRGHLEVLHENKDRLSDKDLALRLADVERTYNATLALPDDAVAHRRAEALDSTAKAVKLALDRISLIERKAPP